MDGTNQVNEELDRIFKTKLEGFYRYFSVLLRESFGEDVPSMHLKLTKKRPVQNPLANEETKNKKKANIFIAKASQHFGNERIPFELSHLDPKHIDKIMANVNPIEKVSWSDICGLQSTQVIIENEIVRPFLFPSLFKGILAPSKGFLLFGPPGTGKTMIAKAIATDVEAKFFNISASTLLDQYFGESEKLVKTLFALARYFQPSIIFVDEIDSLLSNRGDRDEFMNRVKNEFISNLEGAMSQQSDRIILLGATNRPEVLDEAARRRLPVRLYIPLPNEEGRFQILRKLLVEDQVKHSLSNNDVIWILQQTTNYSGSDMTTLCRTAAKNIVSNLPREKLANTTLEDLRSISCEDFRKAIALIRPSVDANQLQKYENWNHQFGWLKNQVHVKAENS